MEACRREKDEAFRLDRTASLESEQRRSFSGLLYFPPNAELDLVLDLEELEPKTTIEMQMTTGDVRLYERFGRVAFEVDGQKVHLTVFRSGGDLFLPFADALAGKETHGAGRYLEPERMPDGRLHIDFKLAYNPYCTYRPCWSCPITPAENRLAIPVRAGEKIFEHS